MKLIIKLFFKIKGITCGKKLLLKGVPVIYSKKGSQIIIGEGVTIKSSFLSNLVGLYQRTIIITRIPGAIIKIGNKVGISGTTIYARKSIEIGDNTLIGANTKIIDNDFHPIEIESRNKNDNSKISAKSIIIEKNCFIGCNSIILKGTILGEGCVVGAGSVVSGVFEANSIIAGNPAKVVKKVGEN